MVMKNRKVEPLVLRYKRLLPQEQTPNRAQRFDPVRQLWVFAGSRVPIVVKNYKKKADNKPTPFGETTITEAPEGTDEPHSYWNSTPFGETVMTKTREGADQIEIANSVRLPSRRRGN
jgi:hypothetical protein